MRAISQCSPGVSSGAYVTLAPFACANSRIPLTELWLSKVSKKRPLAANGNDSPTNFSAAEAFCVKTRM